MKRTRCCGDRHHLPESVLDQVRQAEERRRYDLCRILLTEFDKR